MMGKRHISATTTGVVLAAIVFLFATSSGLKSAEAHILRTCLISSSNAPQGNILKGTDVWVALKGSGALVKYPHTDCNSRTAYTIGGSPTFLAVSGSSRIAVTDNVNNNVKVFRTDTGTVERTVSLSYSPWDIYTDPSNSDQVFFTEQGTYRMAKMTVSTGAVTQITYPVTTANPRGIVIDSSNVYTTDLGNNKIYKYDKATGTWTSKTVTEGSSYGIMIDTTNGQLYAPLYGADKLVGMPTSMNSYVLIDKHPLQYSTNGQPVSGMYRVGNCNTDACLTYLNSGHTGAIHIQGLPAYHNADYVGGNPVNVLYDIIVPNQTIGTHVTVQGGTNAQLVMLTHFPA